MLWAIIISFAAPFALKSPSFGLIKTLIMLTCFSFACLLFVYFCVKETKDLSLEKCKQLYARIEKKTQ
jgi:hypothetical protein